MGVLLGSRGVARRRRRARRGADAARGRLSPRALARRQRVRGDQGVDARDLPIAPAYLQAVAATGARVRVASRWLNAVSVDATPAQRAARVELAGVAWVAPVRRGWRDVPVVESRSLQRDLGLADAQLEQIGADYLQQCGLSGAGVVVGVQDSGFLRTHKAIAGIPVIAARDFVNGDDEVGPEEGDPDDQHIHGSLVLSLLAGDDPGTFRGAAPGVRVLLSKTEDVSQEVMAEEDYFVAGIEWIEAEGADIFTASLGYFDWYQADDFDGQTAVTTQAVEVAVANGLIVFNAMGNAGPGPTTMGAPADAAGAISIGATDFAGTIAPFSSRGPTADGRVKPDVSAPGVDVVFASPNSLDEYGATNGTSLATPLAAGVGALLLEADPTLTPETMAERLRSTASQADAPDNDYGWGVLDGRAAVGAYCECSDVDDDGHRDVACDGDDCDDTRDDVYPGAAEVCDGVDNNCDDVLLDDERDDDGDGVLLCAGDCDDHEPAAAPGLLEICGDGIDNDCLDGDALCPDEDDDSTGSSGPESGTDAGDSDTDSAG
ncbi:MAG: S8 family serine peptidase, partial [Nannocystaceae bacterium]